MLNRKIAFLVAALALLLVASLGTLYAFQQPSPRQAGTDAYNCSGGAVTAGVAIITCTSGLNICLVARSTTATGGVAVSCK